MLFLLQHMVPLAAQVCLDVPVATARMVLLAGRLVLLAESLVLRVARLEILEEQGWPSYFCSTRSSASRSYSCTCVGKVSIDWFGRCLRPPGEWSRAW